MHYNYIIAGAGCAGLSLLYRMLNEPSLQNKQILLLDKDVKNSNDRTWCYWEKGKGLFESVVRHQWKTLEFKTETFANNFELGSYHYKMIRGIDFYTYVFDLIKKFKNVDFRVEEIKAMDAADNKAKLTTNVSEYAADYIFNSTNLFTPQFSIEDTLLQHFMGWEIKTQAPVFNQNIGTLMDFSISQKHGTTFMYVLPVSHNQALVEYTLFTKKVLEKDEYRKELQQYITKQLTIKDFEIVDDEYGVIPMSKQKFPLHFKKRIINLGTAGGNTKASSGYTFQFIQTFTEKVIQRLKQDKSPLVRLTFRDKIFRWYDRTLIEVILSKKMRGKDIFTKMFKKVQAEKILKFLGNESSYLEDFKIMNSLPVMKFLPAGIKELLKK